MPVYYITKHALQRAWESDIALHSRMTAILSISSNPLIQERARNNIARIEARYPQHFKKTVTP